jgi:hypothetical protein
MISINVRVGEDQLRTVRESLRHIPGAADKAIMRAINKAIEGARTDAIKAITQQYYIKAADVRKTIHLIRAKPGNLEGQVVSSGGPFPMIKFNVKPKKPENQRGKRVSARAKVIAGIKFGVIESYPEAFIATVGAGHVGVFERKGDARLPINQKYRLSVPQMLGNKDILEYIDKRAQDRLDKELLHQTKYLFGGGR